MAAAAALENRVLDALMPVLQAMGTPATDWLTQPVVAEGVPADRVPESTRPHVYLQFIRTEELPAESGLALHRLRVTCHVYIVAKDMRTVNSAKADVLRALFAAEGPLTEALGFPAWPGLYQYRDDMSAAGRYVGEQVVTVDADVAHAAP